MRVGDLCRGVGGRGNRGGPASRLESIQSDTDTSEPIFTPTPSDDFDSQFQIIDPLSSFLKRHGTRVIDVEDDVEEGELDLGECVSTRQHGAAWVDASVSA